MAIYCKKYQNKVRDSKMYGKWYMKTRPLRTIQTEEIAEEISEVNTVTEADVRAVLSSLKVIMRQKLQAGMSVKLDGIGTFRTTVSCSPADAEATCRQTTSRPSTCALHPRRARTRRLASAPRRCWLVPVLPTSTTMPTLRSRSLRR